MAWIPYILNRIGEQDPHCAAAARAVVDAMDPVYHECAESFLARYASFMTRSGKTIDFGIGSFLKLRESREEERLHFSRTGEYSSKSFEEVNQRVYSNPERMEFHMHGLVLAQFLWPDQYRRFTFFRDNLPAYRAGVRRYLEVGSGHGLYLIEAMRLIESAQFDAVDISPSSMELVEGMIGDTARSRDLRYRLIDIFDLPESEPYDFVTMGEVLEHVEQPLDLLRRLHQLLSAEGHAYITTPANAPTQDHIYLFHNTEEIREMFGAAGFAIEQETSYCATTADPRKAARLKLPVMFAAFVKKA